MNITGIQTICNRMAGVTEDIKLGEHLCFNVGGKSFLFTAPDRVPVSVSFKVPDEIFEEITCREGIIPQPYIARYKWVLVDDINRLLKQEWEHYIKQSYLLIAAKLPARTRRGLGL